MALRLKRASDAAALGVAGLSFGVRNSARTKFGNVKTYHESPVIGAKVFDSKWEAELCSILDAMVAAGEIRTFLDQVRVSLCAKTDAGNRRYMAVDFMVIDNQGRCHWLDAKGRVTAKWALQRDLAWHHHKIDVIGIAKGQRPPDFDAP